MLKSILEEMKSNVMQKVVKAVKMLPKDQFLDMVKRGRIGGSISIGELVKHIEDNTSNKIDYEDVKNALKKDTIGKYYLWEIDPKNLKIQDEEIVDKENDDRSGSSDIPIVVNVDYYVVDGRHRALAAKKQGKKIEAYIPAELFYDLNK